MLRKDYYIKKYLEMLNFDREVEMKKKLIQQKIQERGEEMRIEIENKTNAFLEENMLKHKKEMDLIVEFEKRAADGDTESVNELLRILNQSNKP